MDITHTFEINEIKCSETGDNYAPQVYLNGFDGGKDIALWFATRPGVSHDQVHALIKHMHSLLASGHLQVTTSPYPRAKAAGRS